MAVKKRRRAQRPTVVPHPEFSDGYIYCLVNIDDKQWWDDIVDHLTEKGISADYVTNWSSPYSTFGMTVWVRVPEADAKKLPYKPKNRTPVPFSNKSFRVFLGERGHICQHPGMTRTDWMRNVKAREGWKSVTRAWPVALAREPRRKRRRRKKNA